jgi:hypothetical protein
MAWLVSLVARILTARSKLLTLPPLDYPLFCELFLYTGLASVTRSKAPVTEAVSIATVQAPLSQVLSFTTVPDCCYLVTFAPQAIPPSLNVAQQTLTGTYVRFCLVIYV